MLVEIKKLVDEIFHSVVYTRKIEEVKEDVLDILEDKYQAQKENGKNEIQATGYIMERYGSLEEISQLVNYRLSDEKEKTEDKAFIKYFRKVRVLTFFIGLLGANVVLNIVNGIVMLSFLRVFAGIAGLLFCLWVYYLYNKAYTSIDDNISLSSMYKRKFYIYMDRYKKRALNSIFILCCCIVCFIANTFERALLTNMNNSELKVLFLNNQTVLVFGMLVLVKSYLDVRFLFKITPERDVMQFRKFVKKQFQVTGIIVVAIVIITLICGIFLTNPYIVLYILFTLASIIGLSIQFIKRGQLVRNNLVINKPVVSIVLVAALIMGSVNYMKKDMYLMQPYIMKVAEVPHSEHDIEYDKENGEYTIVTDDNDFKILHLTDIHIGGSTSSFYKDYKAFEACRKIIEYTKPDFIVITGDLVFPMGVMSYSLNNEAPVIQFASFMRNIGIPWAFTYGNHDTENMATGSRTDIDELYKSLSYENSGNLLYPYVKPDITGRCNQIIKIENEDGNIRQALFLLDSNDYTGAGLNDYDYIHDDQVEWYEENVINLSKEQGKVVPSMLFFHIPLQEYRTAYKLYEDGSDEVKYFFGENGENVKNKVCCSNYPSKLFDTAVELGSTKAMFCGHDHYNNMSLEYKGIRLTYGMSIDYLAMPKIDRDKKQRGAEVITVKKDSSFEIEQIPLEQIK